MNFNLKNSFALLLGFLLAWSGTHASAEEFAKSSREFVDGITAGWNLGNTLETFDNQNEWPKGFTVEFSETKWCNPVTTPAMFEKVRRAGFDAVRIPVTWGKFTTRDRNGNYVIDQKFLKRVREVVGYAQKNGLITILNMHHDDRLWFDLGMDGEKWDTAVERYRQTWAIIAREFRDYGENLVFEAGKEMIAPDDWWGHQQAYFDRQNQLFQTFWKTVRESGGKNARRYLVLPTYGAQWFPQQYERLWLPENDTRIICDIHLYSAEVDPQTYEEPFRKMAEYFRSRGVAVIFGECGLQGQNVQLAEDWAPAFVGAARKNGIPCFVWDDGGSFQMLVRQEGIWRNPFYVQAVLDAATGKTPVPVNQKKKGDIAYENWYCNNGASIITADGSAVVTSGSSFVKQVQPCYSLSESSAAALKELARKSKDGFVYIDFAGRFETGSDQNKLFFQGGLKDGGGWEVGGDWKYTLESGGKVTVPFPAAEILNSKGICLTIQANNYTYGSGIRNLKMTISLPYLK